jgi:hypothetical protein
LRLAGKYVRAAEKLGCENGARIRPQRSGRPDLDESAFAHHRDPVGQRQRLPWL